MPLRLAESNVKVREIVMFGNECCVRGEGFEGLDKRLPPASQLNPPKKRRAVFLDRDGVINLYGAYVHTRNDFVFRAGIVELLQAAQTMGYLLLVVTNQSGIARGYYTESEFIQFTRWMIGELAKAQVNIAAVYYCPYHPVHGIGIYKQDSVDRKPKPGMLLRAQSDFNLDLSASIMIGDKAGDICAAREAQVGTRILLRSKATEPEIPDDCHVSNSLRDVRRKFFSPTRNHGGR